MTTEQEHTHPDTPEWFIPYKEENEQQHAALKDEIAGLRLDITKIPQKVIEGLRRVSSTGGGNPYSPETEEEAR